MPISIPVEAILMQREHLTTISEAMNSPEKVNSNKDQKDDFKPVKIQMTHENEE